MGLQPLHSLPASWFLQGVPAFCVEGSSLQEEAPSADVDTVLPNLCTARAVPPPCRWTMSCEPGHPPSSCPVPGDTLLWLLTPARCVSACALLITDSRQLNHCRESREGTEHEVLVSGLQTGNKFHPDKTSEKLCLLPSLSCSSQSASDSVMVDTLIF